MANKGQDITTYLEMDISGLKKSISEANANLKLIRSEFNAVSGHTAKWEHSVDLLTNKLESLAAEEKVINLLIQQHTAIFKKSEAQYNDNKKLAEEYKKQLIELTEKGVKKSSDEYQKLARELEVCEGHMYDARIEMKKQDVSINNLNGDLLRTQNEQKKYTEELAKAIKEEERQNSALGKLEKAIEDQTKELSELKEEYKSVVIEQGESSDSAKELARRIDDLSSDLAVNKEKLSDAAKSADDLDQSLVDTKDGAEKAKEGFTVLKGVVVNFVTDALRKAVDGLKEFIDKAIEFESSFADVRKVLGDVSTEELDELEESIRELALVRPETASEISEITAMAAQLGVRGNDNLMKFTDTMVKLGDSTNLTGEEASETFAKFINIMGTSQGDIDRVGAAVVNLGNNFATTEKDIAEMSMRLGAAGKLAGMSEAEVLGVAAALSSVGINAEAGGSAFSKLIINMSNASANGKKANEIISSTGKTLRELQMLSDADSKAFTEMAQSLGYTSDEFNDFLDASATLEQFSKVTGMTADEFNKAYGEDAVGTIQKFINSLAGMEDSQALQILDEMGIKEIRLRDTILRSTTGVENFNKALEVSNQGWEENIALDNEANQRYQTTESRIKMMKNRFTEVGIKLKKEIQPAIDAFLVALNWIADNAEPIGAALLTVASAIGAYLVVTKVIPALKVFNATLAANPAGMIAAAIAAVVTAIIILWTKCKWFRDFWKNLWNGIKQVFFIAVNAIVDFFGGIGDWFYDRVTDIKNAFDNFDEWLSGIFEDAWNGIVDFFGSIGDWFYDRILDIKNAFDKFDEWLSGVFEDAWNGIVDFFIGIGDWFYDRVLDIKGAFDKFDQWLSGLFEDAWNGIVSTFEGIGSWFGDRWTDIKNTLSSVGTWFKDKFQEAKDNVTSVFYDIGSWFTDRYNDITDAFSDIGDWFSEKFNDAAEAVKKIWQGVVDFFEGVRKKLDWLFGGTSLVDGNRIKAQVEVSGGTPKMATGGVLKKGQVGFLEGDGAEAVVPLDKNKLWIAAVAKEMSKAFDKESVSSSVNNAKQTVNNFTQIINAPKQPSRIELYRQTRNLLNFSQGGV